MVRLFSRAVSSELENRLRNFLQLKKISFAIQIGYRWKL